MTDPAKRTSLRTCWTSTKERNKLIQEVASGKIRELLGGFTPLEAHLCIATTGSDGRLEKGFFSKVGIVIYAREEVGELVQRVVPPLSQLMSGDVPLINTDETEVKLLGGTGGFPRMSMAYGDRNLVFPQRVLDCVVLAGNASFLEEAKSELVSELTGLESRKIKEGIANRKRMARAAMLSGKQVWKSREITNYDLESGVSYFSVGSDGGDARSFKHGPLRFVQYSVVNEIISMVREMGDDSLAYSLVADMPTPTTERLSRLGDIKRLKLSREQIEDAIDSYIFFLHLYHVAEDNFRAGKSEYQFDRQEAKERIASLNTIFPSKG